MRFVDTNVLLYTASTDPVERDKAEIARALLEATDLALSVQVLQEFYVQATHARRTRPLAHEQAARLIQAWLRFPVQDVTIPVMLAASETAHASRIWYWDAAVIEAARAMGCTLVLSEDLAHGRDYDGVVVENPFRAT